MAADITRDLPMQSRRASFVPGTFDAKNRTIDVVWSTGARVPRRSFWDGKVYDEELSLDPAHVRLERLNNGAPVLDTHGTWQLGDIIGVVEKASVAGAEARATLRLSEREDVAPLVADIQAGIIRNVSCGYIVYRYEITKVEGQRELWRATDWEPTEISFVPVPADAGAGTRASSQTFPCVLVGPGADTLNPEKRMSDTPSPGAPGQVVMPATPPAPQPVEQNRQPEQQQPSPTPVVSLAPADVDSAVQRAISAERERAATIRQRARAVGLDDDFAEQLVRSGVAVDHVGNQIVDELARRGTGMTRPMVRLVEDHTDPDKIRTRMADAIVARHTLVMPPEHAREFVNFRVADFLITLANARGAKLDPRDHIAAVDYMFTRAGQLTTSDFPLLLQDAGNKIMLPKYQAAPVTYRIIAAQRPFNDFKAHKFLRLGDFPALTEIKQAGELSFGAVSENREQVTAKQYGSGIAIDRIALINDDLGAFGDFVMMIGIRVAHDENKLVWAVLANDGPTMSDGVTLFHANHGNKAGAGTDIDVSAVGAGVAAMREQKSLDGMQMNIAPRYICTGSTKELKMRQLLTQVQPTKATDVNPYPGTLEPVVDTNISGNRWHLVADPALLPTVVYGWVNGMVGPQIRSEIDFSTRALKVAVGDDFAAGAVDYRGGYLNTGA